MSTVDIDIIHFNDVYHIDPQKVEPVGGASRFVSAIKSTVDKHTKNKELPLVLFSGDLFNPSVESSITRGSHMVPVINRVGVEVACYGNHDFDFGIPRLVELSEQCQFPWLLSNVFDETTGKSLARGKAFHIVERFGFRIGIIGLVEQEWLETIPALPSNVLYKDFVQVGRELVALLYSDAHKCDTVIALTHMRIPNDIKLRNAFSQREIPLILGGHDHFFSINSERIVHPSLKLESWDGCDIRVIKSGCDFREFSHITLTLDRSTCNVTGVHVERIPVDSHWIPDAELDNVLAETRSVISETMERRVAYTAVPLEARSDIVRRFESNLGNFSADLVRLTYGTDVALLCGGVIRSDAVYGPGPLTVRDIMDVFPFEDPCVVKVLKGKDLLEAIENGISAVPEKSEGRFPQISGLKLTYNSQNPPGKRIVSCYLEPLPLTSLLPHFSSTDLASLCSSPASATPPLTCDSSKPVPVDPEKEYTVATREYLALGNDGFRSLERGKYVVDGENGMLLSALLRRFFLGAKYMNILRQTSKRATHPKDDTHQKSPQEDAERVHSTVLVAVDKFRKLSPKYVQKCLICPPQIPVSASNSESTSNATTPISNPRCTSLINSVFKSDKIPSGFSVEKKDKYLPVIAPVVDHRIIDISPM